MKIAQKDDYNAMQKGVKEPVAVWLVFHKDYDVTLCIPIVSLRMAAVFVFGFISNRYMYHTQTIT